MGSCEGTEESAAGVTHGVLVLCRRVGEGPCVKPLVVVLHGSNLEKVLLVAAQAVQRHGELVH